MTTGFHPPLEQYLAAIYELEEEGLPTIQARVAERLGYTAPTVSQTIAKLRSDGYLRVSGRSLRLTSKGRKVAESVVRKHRLAERLLADVIGLEWHKVHGEAGRWEHVISDEVEERLVELLGHPRSCPHGNPIPGASAPPKKLRKLSAVRTGEEVRLERVTETVELDLQTLQYLDANGLRPGATAAMRTKAPDGTLTVSTNTGEVAIGPALAELLYVSA